MATGIGFYHRAGKRMFDTLASATALLALLPVFLIVAVLIKLTSAGPVFYVQNRVGKGGKLFRIVKFRSMRNHAEQFGSPITWRGDTRVTGIGGVLRFLKIDELPQLWNVLNGEMSLVGPRPELPVYVRYYDATQRRVLAVRPGITDPGSIRYRHEERLLGQFPDPESFYKRVIVPDKLGLNLKYLERMSFSYDMLLLAKTAGLLWWSGWARNPRSHSAGYRETGALDGKLIEITSAETKRIPTFVSASTL